MWPISVSASDSKWENWTGRSTLMTTFRLSEYAWWLWSGVGGGGEVLLGDDGLVYGNGRG